MFLQIDHLSKTFPLPGGGLGNGTRAQAVCVFEKVNFNVAKGEFVTIIGHSGCGKSTLVNIIAGFDKSPTGGVVLDGREIAGPGLDRMVVFQNFALMPWLSAYENVAIAVRAAHPGWKKATVREHAQRYLEMMGLKEAGQKRPALLSGGMRQRVGLARAFAVEPKVLLLDEPFAQIDALTRGIIQGELIRMWSATKNTVVMVTHDVDEAILLSDRILLMSNAPRARIAESLAVELPRPRKREEVIDSKQYSKMRNRILHFLMDCAAESV